MWPKMVRGSPLLLLLLLALKVNAEAEPEAAPKPQPQDPQYNDDYYSNNYGDDYGDNYYGYDDENGDGQDYEAPSQPDEDVTGLPAEYDDDSGNPEASRWDRGNSNDPCRGVVCPELDCPERPYIPQGECCPVCPSGRSQVAPVRPDLQVSEPHHQV